MRLLQSAFIYIVASVLNKATPFLLLPVLTRYLEPSEFGAIALFLVANNCVSAFVGMNVSANVSKNFFFLSKERLAILIGNMLLLMMAISAVVLLCIFAVSIFFNELFSIPVKYLYAMPILSFMMMVNTINLTILRNEYRPYMFGLFEITCTVITISTTAILLVFYDVGWQSQVYGLLFSYLIFFLIALAYMRKRQYLCFKPTAVEVNSILKLSLPMIPYVLSGIIINSGDRIFIERIVGLDALGIYAIGYSFGMIIMLFTDAFNKAWSPWFYKKMKDPTLDIRIKIVKLTYFYIISIFVLALSVSFFSKMLLPFVVSEKFHSAEGLILWISLAYAVQGIYKMFFPYFILTDSTHAVARILVISAICSLLANYFFISNFGSIGAAFAMLAAWSVTVVLAVIFQVKHVHMPWRLRFGKPTQDVF